MKFSCFGHMSIWTIFEILSGIRAPYIKLEELKVLAERAKANARKNVDTQEYHDWGEVLFMKHSVKLKGSEFATLLNKVLCGWHWFLDTCSHRFGS